MARVFDRLSELPDNILTCNILSLLPLTDAIRTSILSRRWRFLWRQRTHLTFELFYCGFSRRGIIRQPRKYINDAINNILMLQSGDLQSFHFRNYGNFREEGEEDFNIEQWVHTAAQKNVKQLSIENHVNQVEVLEIPVSIFACKQLTDLRIRCSSFTRFPLNFEGFLFLRSLEVIGRISSGKIERLMTLCPILETLKVKECYDFTTLKINALNLKRLVFNGYSLAADCPQLVSMKIHNFSSLSTLQLNSCVLTKKLRESGSGSFRTSSHVKSLRKLSLTSIMVAVPPCHPPRGSFPDLEELKLSGIFFKEVSEEEIELAESNMITDFTFPNLQIAHIDMSHSMNQVGKPLMSLVSVLLKNAPSLHTMFLTLLYCPTNTHDSHYKEFLDILHLEETLSNENIKIVTIKKRRCPRCIF